MIRKPVVDAARYDRLWRDSVYALGPLRDEPVATGRLTMLPGPARRQPYPGAKDIQGFRKTLLCRRWDSFELAGLPAQRSRRKHPTSQQGDGRRGHGQRQRNETEQ